MSPSVKQDLLEGNAPFRGATKQELEVHAKVLELLTLRVLHDRLRVLVFLESDPLLIPADRFRLSVSDAIMRANVRSSDESSSGGS
jgi:hypothetical protein